MRDLVRVGRRGGASYAALDGDAPGCEEGLEPLTGGHRGIAGGRLVARVGPTAVDRQRAERTDVTLGRVDGLPHRKEAQRLVEVVVDRDRTGDVAHSRGHDGIRELRERREGCCRELSLRMLVRDVLGRRQQRVARADDVEVTVFVHERPGGEAVVGAEAIDRSRRRQEFQRRRRREGDVGVDACEDAGRAVDGDAASHGRDDGREALRQFDPGARQCRALDGTREERRRPAGRPQRRAQRRDVRRGDGRGRRRAVRRAQAGDEDDGACRGREGNDHEARERAPLHVTGRVPGESARRARGGPARPRPGSRWNNRPGPLLARPPDRGCRAPRRRARWR